MVYGEHMFFLLYLHVYAQAAVLKRTYAVKPLDVGSRQFFILQLLNNNDLTIIYVIS